VVEVGTNYGASALWFLDRMRTFQGHGRTTGELCVISVDIDHTRARAHLAGVSDLGTQVVLVERDVRAPGLAEAVAAHIPEGATVMLVEDGAHEEDTTLAALEQLAGLVSEEGFLVVEDGVVDVEELRIHPTWPRGVLPAVARWLETPAAAGFRPRPDLEVYGLTCHPCGFFQRVAAS
jgi:cephalosporin hydroxylase